MPSPHRRNLFRMDLAGPLFARNGKRLSHPRIGHFKWNLTKVAERKVHELAWLDFPASPDIKAINAPATTPQHLRRLLINLSRQNGRVP